jgi:hypothetical protein
MILELFPFYTSCLVYLELFYRVLDLFLMPTLRCVYVWLYPPLLFIVPTLEPVAAPNLFCEKSAEVILNFPFYYNVLHVSGYIILATLIGLSRKYYQV